MKHALCKVYEKDKQAFFSTLEEALRTEKKTFVITANAEIFTYSKKNPTLYDMLTSDDITVIADGISVVKACGMIGREVEKITGVETVSYLLEKANELHKSIFLLGCRPEVVALFRQKLACDYPNIVIKDLVNGYIEHKDDVFRRHVAEGADLVFTALGVPNQELLIHKYFGEAKKGIFIGIGGSIDVISGAKKRAPKFFQKHNIEWLYRIMKEPNRIRRFYQNNIKFIRDIRKLKR